MNRQDLQTIAEAYSQVQEKKDSSYLETDMKKRQKNNEKARKDMEKMGTPMKNPHFEEAGADEKSMKKFQELQKNVDQKKKNIRGNDSAEQKARLEKKRGMKLDDHPQFKKEEVSGIAAAYQAVYNKVEEEVEDIEEADSLAAMAARREKRLKAQRKKEGTSATGQDFGHDYGMPAAERKKKQKAEFDAFIGRGKKKTNEEVEAVDEGLTGARADRARQMQDSDTKSKGGTRTPADRDTAFRLGTGTGPGRVSDRPIKSQSDQGKGNAAKRRMKEDLEATGKFTAEEIEAILEQEIEEGKLGAAAGSAIGGLAGAGLGALAAGPMGATIGGTVGTAAGAALGAKKGRKKDAAVGSLVAGPIGAAIASSHEMEGNPIYEATKEDIEQYAVNEIAGALKGLASAGASAVKGLGAMGGETGTQIANAVVKGGKDAVKLAKKHPVTTAAVGGAAAGLAAGKMMDND